MKIVALPSTLSKRVLYAGLLVSLSISPVLKAQQTKNSETNQAIVDPVLALSKFVVSGQEDKGYLAKNTLSGTRSDARLIDISQEIAVVNKEILADLAVDSALPAIQFVTAGLNRRSFNPGDDQYIRGFRLSGSLKDGFSMASNAVGGLYDVERVEVIKGPAALIYGQAASLGGIINYVSRKPTRTLQAEAKVVVGSFDYYRGELHVSGPVNKKLRYRADAGYTDSKWSGRRFGFYKDQFLGGGLEYEISERTLLQIDGYATEVNFYRPTTMLDPLTGKMLAQSKDFSLDEDFAYNDTHQQRATATLTSKLTEQMELRLFAAYNNSGNDWLRPEPLELLADNATLPRYVLYWPTSDHFTNVQADLIWEFATGPLSHKLSIGGDARFVVNSYLGWYYDLASINVRNPVYGANINTKPGSSTAGIVEGSLQYPRLSSLYVQDQIDFLQNRVSLVFGARYNDFKQVFQDPFFGPTTWSYRQDSKTVHRIGALYHPVKNTSIYFNNSQSFTFNFGTDTITKKPFVPSVGEVKEIGVKAELFEGALVFSAAYFDMELTNVRITYTQGPTDPLPGAQAVRQTGVEKNKGYEATLATSTKLGSGELNGIATIYHGDVRNAQGLRPAGPVNDTYSVFATYKYTDGSLKGFGFGGGVRMQGDWVGPNMRGGIKSYLDGYSTVSALLTYQRSKLRLQLNVDNLLDKSYVEGFEVANWIYPSKGREIKFSASYRF